jgi:serine/threonine-protein kinase
MPSSNPSADHNLLLGILALQMDFVSRDALIVGMQAWVFNKSTPLGQILLDQGALQADTHALLEALVQKHLQIHGDAEKSLASVSSIGSLRDQLSQIDDQELCASIAHVSAARQEEAVPGTRAPVGNENEEAEAPATRPPSVGTPTSSGLRFRILRPHARGGLGEVFVACDEELHREVALKEIQGRHADHPDSRTRFVVEAEITGGLEHPGIVPVYGLGHYADGRPFYAMRFIRGDSLQQAIEAFHKADVPDRDPGERALSLRGLLGRFVDVCNAIAYAHSRGVLHRDLKPGNIMLGNYGETLVVDWGLAKAGGGRDPATVSAEGMLRPTSASGSAPTQMGQAVGTPAYMSPEQAAGRLDLLGPASDVYSLGATLYCLLTGKLPFEGNDDGALLQRVQKGDYLLPRQVKRNTPADLEASCIKAMALRPEDRYASARALADDIEHWLADEPVSAWREPLAVRMRRWLGRHRTLVTGVAAAVLVATVTLSAATLLLMAANQRERQARQDAEANLDLAKEVVDECFNVCKDHPLFQQPGMEKVKKLLLEKTLPFYERMVEQRPIDRGLLWEEADQWYRIGYIEYVLGKTRQARTAYEKARERYDELLKTHPDQHLYQSAQANTHNHLGLLLVDLGEVKEALKAYQHALVLFRKLVKAHPHLHQYGNTLAGTHNNRGTLLLDVGERKEALMEYEQARDLLLQLVKAHPDLHDYQNALAGTHNNLGVALSHLGERKEALKEYLQARDLRLKLVKAHPDLHERQNDLARTHCNIGNLLGNLGESKEALKEYLQARNLQQKLVKAHPDLPQYQYQLAVTHNYLGTLLKELGERKEALKEYEQARALQLKLVKTHPDLPKYQNVLASTHNSLGNLLGELGEWKEALKEYLQARNLQQKLVKAHPDLHHYQQGLASTHNNVGNLLKKQGERKEALKEYLQARDLRFQLVKAHPDRHQYQNDLASTHYNLGILLSELGERKEALKQYQQGRDLQLQVVKAHPDLPNYQNKLALIHYNLGNLQSGLGERKEALKEYLQARELFHKLVKAHPNLPGYGIYLAGTCCNTGNLLRDSGRATESLSHYTEAVTLLRTIHQRYPQNATARLFLRNSHWGRADSLAVLGRHGEAAGDWEQALRLDTGTSSSFFRLQHAESRARAGDYARATTEAEELGRIPSLPGAMQYNLACIYALNAIAAGKDHNRPLAEREKRARQYASAAFALVERARRSGFFKDPKAIVHMKKDSDLELLRQSEDFRLWLKRLEGGSNQN